MSELSNSIPHAERLAPRGRAREPRRGTLMIVVDTGTRYGDQIINRGMTLADSNVDVLGATAVRYEGSS